MTNSQRDGLQAAKNLLMYQQAIYASLDHRPETQAGVKRLFDKIREALDPTMPEKEANND
jgi:hypothetical protein